MKLREKIKAVEQLSAQLEPQSDKRAHWTEQVNRFAYEFIDTIHDRKTFEMDPGEGKQLKEFGFDSEPRSIEDVLQVLQKDVFEPGLNPASGGHIAYIPGGGIYPTALGDYLADVSNEYAGIFFAGPGAVRMENQLIRWMCDMMGYPERALGNLTSGGSIANLVGIATARDAKQIDSTNIKSSVIYLTAQAHHSVQKAVRIAGLNECPIRYIPMDDRFRMDDQALARQVQQDKAEGLSPFLLVAAAGTTDTGAVDPLDKLADIAEASSMWFHVDAAYGGFFILDESLKDKFKGIERSDSITIDPHKGLFLSYGTGAILIKNVAALHETHRYKANYMQDAISSHAEPSPAELSPELTKHWRGLRMWLPMQLYGLKAMKAAIHQKRLLTLYFYEEIQKLGFEVGPEPDLSVMIYRYQEEGIDSNQLNTSLIEEIHKDGRVFLSSTTINGLVWLRLAVLCFRTDLMIVDRCLDMIKECLLSVRQRLQIQG